MCGANHQNNMVRYLPISILYGVLFTPLVWGVVLFGWGPVPSEKNTLLADYNNILGETTVCNFYRSPP